DRDGALVARDGALGAAPRRGHRERADEGERVEHAPPVRELLDARAERALIDVEPCLLAYGEGHGVAEAALAKAERVDRRVAADDAAPRVEALELRDVRRRAIDDRARAEGARDLVEDHALAELDAERAELDGHHVG